MRKNKQLKEVRGKQGFSLVTVLCLGLISTMVLFALSSSILPLYQKASQNVPYLQLRTAAESGVNLAVAELNNSILSQTESTYDDLSPGIPYTTKIYNSGIPNAPKVQITVKNEFPPSSSPIYDAAYDTNISGGANSSSVMGKSDSYRIIEATAYYDAGVSPQVMVRSIIRLSPVQYDGSGDPPPAPQVTLPSFLTSKNPSQNTNPVFKYAAFATNSLSIGQSTTTSGYDSRDGSTTNLAGDIATNGSASLSGTGIDIAGSLTVSSPSSSPYNASKVASGTQPPVIHDQLIVNGTADGDPIFTGTNGPASPLVPQVTDTVRGESRGPLDVGFQPIITGGSTDPNVVPPTPAVPETAHAISAPQNGAQLVFSNTASYPPSAAALAAYQTGGTLSLPPGDYSLNSMSIGLDGSNSSIKINSDVSQPVRLFVDGNSSSEVSITRNGIQNASSSPANLQLYYSGTNAVSLSAAFTGVLYAPNANVNVGKPSGTLNVFGSIVGRAISTKNCNLFYDSALSDVNFQNNTSRAGYSKASNLTFDPSLYSSLSAKTGQSFSGFMYRVISYQEMKNPQP